MDALFLLLSLFCNPNPLLLRLLASPNAYSPHCLDNLTSVRVHSS
jgi:hypothetical protein